MDNETVRWNLQCIPVKLDTFIRHRQIEEGTKYLCQQVVTDLTAYYKILLAKKLMEGDGNG